MFQKNVPTTKKKDTRPAVSGAAIQAVHIKKQMEKDKALEDFKKKKAVRIMFVYS